MLSRIRRGIISTFEPSRYSNNIYIGGSIIVPGGTSYVYKGDNTTSYFVQKVKDIIAKGYMCFDITFTYQGVAGKAYTGETKFQFRTGSGTEFQYTLDNARLSTGEPIYGHMICDISTLSRYYTMNGQEFDRYNIAWQVFGRNQTTNEGSITYSNIVIKYLKERSE